MFAIDGVPPLAWERCGLMMEGLISIAVEIDAAKRVVCSRRKGIEGRKLENEAWHSTVKLFHEDRRKTASKRSLA